MALGTLPPLFVFGLIGGLLVVWRSDNTLLLECAAITLGFACLQAYIFNTALHPANRSNLVGGLLPNFDPSMYLSLANQWSDGIRPVVTGRHLFPCLLSSMLWICGRDLKMIVSVFTLLTGVLSFVAWHQVRITFGWSGATLFLALVFFFYRCEGVGLLFTEQLGLWFALIALALMLQGLREKREGLWCTGLFSLVMGLSTRAGAYFILPLLILYSGWIFRRGARGWRSVLSAGLVCAIGMVLNAACYWIFSAPPRPPSNFWLCFYGMLKGGNWISAMNEVGHDYSRAREKAMDLLRAEPWLVLKGFLRACVFVWKDNTFYGHPPTAETFRLWMKWLTVLGAVVPWGWSVMQKRRAELESFVLLVVLGTVISLPFAPPWDGGVRVYAVAFPFLYLSPVMLISWSCGALRKYLPLRSGSPGSLAEQNHLTYADGKLVRLTQAGLVILLFFAMVVPLSLMLSKRHRITDSGWHPQFCVPLPRGCPAKNLPTGYQIHLISDKCRTFVPWIRISDFRRSNDGSVEKFWAPWWLELLDDLQEGTTIGTACQSRFFVIGTDKARTRKISQRHPIFNAAWHLIVYDNDYPLSPYSRQILSQPKAPSPCLPGDHAGVLVSP